MPTHQKRIQIFSDVLILCIL